MGRPYHVEHWGSVNYVEKRVFRSSVFLSKKTWMGRSEGAFFERFKMFWARILEIFESSGGGTSPGGTAIEGLHTLEEGGLRTTLINAVVAATARSRELASTKKT